MTTQAQMLAIKDGVRSKADQVGAQLMKLVQAPIVNGISRVYTPWQDGGEVYPAESTLVQVKVPDVLRMVTETTTRYFDVQLTMEEANTKARADIVVTGLDGGPRTLVEKVPVAYLLFLGHQLDELKVFISKLPVLDPAFEWTWDPANGYWRTPATQTVKTKKKQVRLVLYEATKEHPAQVQMVTEDVNEGTWSTVKSSGAITAEHKRVLTERVDALKEAVDVAREQANSMNVTDYQAGAAILGYLFGEA